MKTRKIFILVVTCIISLSASAQSPNKRHGEQNMLGTQNIECMVDNLSKIQKRKLDKICKESQKRTDILHAKLHTVRDSIQVYMEKEGDQSAKIYPLFNKEANLRLALTKERYRVKTEMDKVLTPDQIRQLRANLKKNAPKDRKFHDDCDNRPFAPAPKKPVNKVSK